jgi:hypothetical protein
MNVPPKRIKEPGVKLMVEILQKDAIEGYRTIGYSYTVFKQTNTNILQEILIYEETLSDSPDHYTVFLPSKIAMKPDDLEDILANVENQSALEKDVRCDVAPVYGIFSDSLEPSIKIPLLRYNKPIITPLNNGLYARFTASRVTVISRDWTKPESN